MHKHNTNQQDIQTHNQTNDTQLKNWFKWLLCHLARKQIMAFLQLSDRLRVKRKVKK